MTTQFFDRFGKRSYLPCSREDAKRFRQKLYIPEDICLECGTGIRYTTNDQCVKCLRLASYDLYNFAVGAMSFIDFPPEQGGGTSTAYQSLSDLGPVGNRDLSYDYKHT